MRSLSSSSVREPSEADEEEEEEDVAEARESMKNIGRTSLEETVSLRRLPAETSFAALN